MHCTSYMAILMQPRTQALLYYTVAMLNDGLFGLGMVNMNLVLRL